ncbi:PTS sugar transporter subunit IIB [Jeotgalibaca ciconiae]|uniref:PTS fructose transporter subunit IIB n=1 Tax=Jeotgalibaca ciconiae TaxID=2496265 RepID=A0A3Q9BLB3_9LACT|nr:PTS sugar transporter subunit IIB [Jeotgalibaca ciconiae]AZP03643.1 PTS fructose transporter subunit IIB [Jeotgalibaca ciconiae]HJB22949.1 PTS sugar transporter subunit IIB [Candidatus Jeotgalibaca pullicola]
MDIQLLRIDDRLIHGQVAITWAKDTRISRIIVVSDEVAANPIQKALLSQAAPPDVKAHVVTLDKLIEVYFHPLFLNVKVMLLFTNPADVVSIYKKGVYFNTVNIGGMKFTDGKTMVTHFISVDQNDIDAFQYLDSQDIELEIRKVPSDRKQMLMDVLKKGNHI